MLTLTWCIGLLFEKLNPYIQTVEFGKNPIPQGLGISFHVFFSGDLYFDALITGIFSICIVMGQTLGEDSCEKVFVGVLRERWGASLVPWASE